MAHVTFSLEPKQHLAYKCILLKLFIQLVFSTHSNMAVADHWDGWGKISAKSSSQKMSRYRKMKRALHPKSRGPTQQNRFLWYALPRRYDLTTTLCKHLIGYKRVELKKSILHSQKIYISRGRKHSTVLDQETVVCLFACLSVCS